MQPAFSVDATRRLVRFDYDVLPTFAQWADAFDAAVAHPDYQPGFSFLLDRSQVGKPTVAYLESVIVHIRENLNQVRGCRCAVVLPLKHLSVSDGVKILAKDLPVTIQWFGSQTEAMAWLEAAPG